MEIKNCWFSGDYSGAIEIKLDPPKPKEIKIYHRWKLEGVLRRALSLIPFGSYLPFFAKYEGDSMYDRNYGKMFRRFRNKYGIYDCF